MRYLLLLLPLLLAAEGGAQSSDITARVSGAAVSGVVYDSIAGTALAGAMVQLVSAGDVSGTVRTSITDSLGWFMFEDVLDGRYLLGFLHPMLDSLGVEPRLREVIVAGRRLVRADLAIPSTRSLRVAVCGQQPALDTSAVVVGVVRGAADRAPVVGANVVADWLELSMIRGGFSRRVPRVTVVTAANGWFGLCDVPASGSIALVAHRGTDSTDVVELHVPADGFLRRDLYIGSARAVVGREPTPSADTLAASAELGPAGRGTLSGEVVAAVGGQPLSDARVSVLGGPQTRTDERGEWTLVDVPLGTRTLEIRALGYYPERRAVDVVMGAPRIRAALSTMSAVLDTVRVTASRLGDEKMRGFTERRRSGVGRYLTPGIIARHSPVFTSDILRLVPGLEVGRGVFGGISLRGCVPAVYIDGHHMRNLSAADINDFVHPDEVAGIEIYSTGTPPQFQPGLSTCGSIVIWTRIRPASRN